MKVFENNCHPETTGKEIRWENCFKLIYFVHELEQHVCFGQIMEENRGTLLFTSWMMCVQAKLEITEVENCGACRVPSTWVTDNKCSEPKGLNFVHLVKHKAFNSGIRFPYEVLFGVVVKGGLLYFNWLIKRHHISVNH